MKKISAELKLRKFIRSEIRKILTERKNLTKWYITHYDEDGDDIKTIKYDIFNKDEIQKKFDSLAKKLKPDEELWFQKDDEKHIGDTIIVVVNRNGKLSREVTVGSKTLYKPYNGKF